MHHAAMIDAIHEAAGRTLSKDDFAMMRRLAERVVVLVEAERQVKDALYPPKDFVPHPAALVAALHGSDVVDAMLKRQDPVPVPRTLLKRWRTAIAYGASEDLQQSMVKEMNDLLFPATKKAD